jgi:hypothetical protein
MNPPNSHILPIGRWIYTAETPNSKGFWFFVGEEVQNSPTTPEDNPKLMTPNSLLRIEPPQINKTLGEISTERLIEELMKRSPDIQRQLILESMNPTEKYNNNHQGLADLETHSVGDAHLQPGSASMAESITTTTSKDQTINSTIIPTPDETDYKITRSSPTIQAPLMPSINTINKDMEETHQTPHQKPYTLEDIDKAVTEKTRKITTPPHAHMKVKGLNEPEIYKPSIEINPPTKDPEACYKRRKGITAEYNPEKPDMERPCRIKCEKCRRSFGNKGSYSRHYRSHHTDNEYRCGECGASFNRRDSLKHHQDQKHSKKNLQDDLHPVPKLNFIIKPKCTLNDLNLPGNISPNLLAKLKNTVSEYSSR